MDEIHLVRTETWFSRLRVEFVSTTSSTSNSARDEFSTESYISLVGRVLLGENAKLQFSARPVGKVVSKDKSELELNVGELVDVLTFEVQINNSSENSGRSYASCRMIGDECRVFLVLSDKNLYAQVLNSLSNITYDGSLQVSFTLGDIWLQQGSLNSYIVFASESLSVNTFEVNASVLYGGYKRDFQALLPVAEKLNLYADIAINEQRDRRFSSCVEDAVTDDQNQTALDRIADELSDIKINTSIASDSASTMRDDVSAIHNIPDEIIHVGNRLRGVRVLLFLNLVALVLLILK